MGFLCAFEMTLTQRKKKKSIAFKTMHKEEDSCDNYNEDELPYLLKILKNS